MTDIEIREAVRERYASAARQSLELTSTAGHGTTVVIRLPRERLREPPAPQANNVIALFG